MKSGYFVLLLASFIGLTSCQTINSSNDAAVSQPSSSETAINVQHRDVIAITSSDNYTRLGAAYLARENYEKASVKLKKAIQLNASNAKAHNYLGVLYWRLDKPQLADKEFKLSQQLAPLNSAVLDNYASFLCSQKRYQEASTLFGQVFSNPLYDRLSNTYQISADCDLEIGKINNAEKKYKKSLQLDKHNALALLGMAKLYYKQANYKIANYYFSRFEELSKNTADSLWLGINIQRKLADKNKVSSYILELKNLYPDSDQTLFLIQGKKFY